MTARGVHRPALLTLHHGVVRKRGLVGCGNRRVCVFPVDRRETVATVIRDVPALPGDRNVGGCSRASLTHMWSIGPFVHRSCKAREQPAIAAGQAAALKHLRTDLD